MNDEKINFIQQNSPDGGFLQSPEWKKFQEAVGRKTYNISSDGFHANIVEHTLPVAGKYFYLPRGPIYNSQFTINNKFSIINDQFKEIIELAKRNNAGWIRIEPNDSRILEVIRDHWRVVKAPHDMQPREIFVIDITKPEEQLLAEMKSKTRYNIRLAEKHRVRVYSISNSPNYLISNKISNDQNSKYYIEEFIRLTGIMAKRQGIATHPGEYYQKMLEIIPGDILKLYVAEYDDKIIAANLVIFYGSACTYLHGASDDQYRNVMAPFLLQWQQIRDAKAAGCERYDFGGVKINSASGKSWAGVTRFKTGFSPLTKPVEFPGCYDIMISPMRYRLYRSIQSLKSLVR